MLETAVALAFGHSLADFLMQTDEMVRHKARPHVLLLHVCIVTAVSWAALGFPLEPLLLLLIGASHFAIDWLKLRHGSGSFGPFVIDQAAHLFMIVARRRALPRRLGRGPLGERPRPLRAPAAGDGARRRLRLHRLGRRLRHPRAHVRPARRPTRTACPGAAA